MGIEIKRLSEENAEDYLRFFDDTPHSTLKSEHRCYCVCWCAADSADEDFSTAALRRVAAVRYIEQGSLKGYLAYAGGKAVGWCNANTKADCLLCLSWRRFMGDVPTLDGDELVKSVFCFAIAPQMRGMGVARALLERVCEDAAWEGFRCVEAYPNTEFISTSDDFMGPMRMYEAMGFVQHARVGTRSVMRKELRGGETCGAAMGDIENG